MNRRELVVKQQLEAEGWKVLRNGAPDFIALKVVEGKITEMKGVEVKSRRGTLSYEQSIYKEVFHKAGILFEIVVKD